MRKNHISELLGPASMVSEHKGKDEILLKKIRSNLGKQARKNGRTELGSFEFADG